MSTLTIDRDRFHEFVDWVWEAAYAQGRQDGREQFAGELLPAVRWACAGLGLGPIEDLDATALRVFTGPFDELMARHLRLVDAANARRAFDRENRTAA